MCRHKSCAKSLRSVTKHGQLLLSMTHAMPEEARRGRRIPWNWSTDVSAQKPNCGSLQEHQELLTTESFLQSQGRGLLWPGIQAHGLLNHRDPYLTNPTGVAILHTLPLASALSPPQGNNPSPIFSPMEMVLFLSGCFGLLSRTFLDSLSMKVPSLGVWRTSPAEYCGGHASGDLRG